MEGIAERLRAFIKAFDVQCTECRCARVGHSYLHNFGTALDLWRGACSRDGLIADAYSPAPTIPDTRDPTVGAGLLAKEASQPTVIYLTPRDPTVGAGLPAKAA